MGLRYEPKDHIQEIADAPLTESVLDQREITVQSFQTTVPFDFDSLDQRVGRAWLAPAVRLGLFQRTPLAVKTEIHVVLGLQGSLSVRAYDYDERRPLYFAWKDVIVETVGVRYFRDEDGLIGFTTFGGGVRIGEDKLHEFNEGFLKIPATAVSKRHFDLDKLRDLCFGRFADRLYMLRFSNPSGDEYRSIDHALFQSRRYIDPGAARFQEVRGDAQVQIESFDSDLPVATIDLAVPVEVRFKIRGLSGALRLGFPKVTYKAQIQSFEEQVRVFYRLVDEAVRSILDANYYAKRRLSLAELQKNPEFPEFADTGPYREVLRAAEAQAEYFAGLDMGTPKQNWLPHLRAIDELLTGGQLHPDVVTRLGAFADRDVGQGMRLLAACAADAKLHRVGAAMAQALRSRLQSVAPASRAPVEQTLLAWALKCEDAAWDVDTEQEVVKAGELQWRVEDLALDALPAVLWKLIGVLHARLMVPGRDLAEDLSKYQWCVVAARALPASHKGSPPALRLVAADRVPRTPADSRRVLEHPAADFAELDEAVLEQFGLPLWPCLRAHRKDGAAVITNDGIGAAVALTLEGHDAGRQRSNPIDVLPGDSIRVPTGASVSTLHVTLTKFGATRQVSVPVAIAADDAVLAPVRRLPVTISRKRIERQRECRKVIDAAGMVVGSSPALLEVFEHIHHANTIDGGAPVLLLGEAGVGKTHIARLLHDSSLRASRPFKAVNAGGSGGDVNIQRGEWIGYGKGHGITGIDKKGKPGHLMEVNGGTLFVDEFATLSPDLQVIFLSVLERRAVERVGGEPFTPDVRCILATNADVDGDAARGQIRRDLLARIPVRIHIPPLRDRRGDVLLLASHFAAKKEAFTDRCLVALLGHTWPDNVRELSSLVARAAARRKADDASMIDIDHVELPDEVIAKARALSEVDCRRELWSLADEIARAEGFEPGAGLQRRAGEILGVGEAQASKMYASFGLARASTG